MNRPRVIIADSDINYITPFESKFIEEYADLIDLEVITDETYLKELFLVPQRLLLLVISENMYDESFLKHEIDHIFLLTEDPADGEDQSSPVKRIFKYTSIRNIFSYIAAVCFRETGEQTSGAKYMKTIAICAGKGGMGKTTVAFGISDYLTRCYDKRVLYLNTAELQTFQAYMNNTAPITDADAYFKLQNEPKSAYRNLKPYIRKNSFYYLPPFRAPMSSLGMDDSVYVEFVKGARESLEYDYIIIDTDTGFSGKLIDILDLSDRVIFVTEQNYAAAFATNRMAENIGGITEDKYLFVCNKYDDSKPNCLVAQTPSLKFSVIAYLPFAPDAGNNFSEIDGIDKLTYYIM